MAPPSTPIFQDVVTYQPDYDRIARSPVINFLIGIDKFPMVIHAAAIESLSTKLSQMVNDSLMTDTKEKAVTMRDVRVEVFRVFTEFAYSGDYYRVANGDSSTNQLKRKVDEANMSQEDTLYKKEQDISNENVSDITGRATQQSVSSTSPSLTAEGQSSAIYKNPIKPSTNFIKLISSIRDRLKSLNYSHKSSESTPRLWVLVDLYIFATRYSIEALRQKTLSTIHAKVCSYRKGAPPEEVITAINTMYSKVSKDESGLLRDLCMRYAACQAAYLYRTKEFEDFLRSNQDFAIDFVRALGE